MRVRFHPLTCTKSVIYMTSAVASPFVGILIDRVGYPLYFLAVACGGYSLMMVVMMFFTFVPPVIPMLGCGICYTLVASSLWPTVPLVVKAHEVGTGMSTARLLSFVSEVLEGAITLMHHPLAIMRALSALVHASSYASA